MLVESLYMHIGGAGGFSHDIYLQELESYPSPSISKLMEAQ